MKKLILSLIIAQAFAGFGKDEQNEFGGDIELWPKDHGVFFFVDAQSKIADKTIATPVKILANDFNIDIRKIAGDGTQPFDIRKAPAALKGLGAKGGIWIVDDPALPISLIAMEDGWGLINVAPVLSDSPNEAKIANRMTKLINRTFASLHGVGDPVMMPACVMKPAVGLTGIDNLLCATFSPETNSKVACYLNLAGYRQCLRGTYYDACENGWAPAPTNAVQQAIWDKVHQLPTKPIKILPPSKKK